MKSCGSCKHKHVCQIKSCIDKTLDDFKDLLRPVYNVDDKLSRAEFYEGLRRICLYYEY